MTESDWATELGVHADDAALEAELAAQLDAEGSALTDRNDFSAFWSVVRAVVTRPIRALEALLVATVPQGFLRYGTGAWLDEKAVEFGATRKAGVKAQGDIAFSRAGTAGNVNIPAGSIVATKTLADGTVKRVVSLAPAVLPDGSASVDVLCQAEAVGAAYNLVAGAYSELVTPIAGVDAVSNGAAWLVTAGVNEETDAELVARVLAAQEPGGEGWIGGDATYRALALNFTGVVDAVVDGSQPRGRGTVDVIVIGGAGTPTPQLIADLAAHLDEQGKPITDDVLVRGPTEISVTVTAEAVALTADPRTDPAIQAEVEAIVDSYFTYGVGTRYLGLSEDYVRAQVAGEAIAGAGLKNLRFAAPAADVVIGPGDLAVAGARTITVAREEA